MLQGLQVKQRLKSFKINAVPTPLVLFSDTSAVCEYSVQLLPSLSPSAESLLRPAAENQARHRLPEEALAPLPELLMLMSSWSLGYSTWCCSPSRRGCPAAGGAAFAPRAVSRCAAPKCSKSPRSLRSLGDVATKPCLNVISAVHHLFPADSGHPRARLRPGRRPRRRRLRRRRRRRRQLRRWRLLRWLRLLPAPPSSRRDLRVYNPTTF